MIGPLNFSATSINWPLTELDAIDKLIRNKMTQGSMYSSGISIYRLYLSRDEVGQGLPNVSDEYAKEVTRPALRLGWWNQEDGEDRDNMALFALAREHSNNIMNRAFKARRKNIY